MKTALVLVLAALCATQIYSAATPPASTNGLVGQVQTLLQQLLSTVQTAITNAEVTINSLLAALIQFINGVVGDLRTDLNSTLSNILDPLNDLVDKATGLGVDITKCGVDSGVAPLLDLPGKLIGSVETCTNGVLNDAEGLVNNTLDSVKGTLGQVTQLTNDLLDCNQGGGLLGLVGNLLGCLTDLLSRVLAAITSIPNHITSLVSGLQGQLTDLEPAVQACTAGVVEQLSSTASPVVSGLITCVQDAISSATSGGAAPPS